ncbi:hypothetical protein HU200_003844 [Digitaria exilis]|uniref:SOSEKI DIX-like domain-containing protein n=1 Tax=Digitaria exilis TaxID=1010633 RepID=A0A835KSU6_9POAL|nr:hypothetical protein HU200_003844 [Digitaria exilis]
MSQSNSLKDRRWIPPKSTKVFQWRQGCDCPSHQTRRRFLIVSGSPFNHAQSQTKPKQNTAAGRSRERRGHRVARRHAGSVPLPVSRPLTASSSPAAEVHITAPGRPTGQVQSMRCSTCLMTPSACPPRPSLLCFPSDLPEVAVRSQVATLFPRHGKKREKVFGEFLRRCRVGRGLVGARDATYKRCPAFHGSTTRENGAGVRLLTFHSAKTKLTAKSKVTVPAAEAAASLAARKGASMEAGGAEGRRAVCRAAEASPERGRPTYAAAARPAPARPMRKVQIIYYLCRNGQLEHPHFMELAQHPHQPLRLKAHVAARQRHAGSLLMVLQENGYVWNDLSENDVIYPSDGVEYVLKGSEIFPGCSSGTHHLLLPSTLHAPHHHDTSSVEYFPVCLLDAAYCFVALRTRARCLSAPPRNSRRLAMCEPGPGRHPPCSTLTSSTEPIIWINCHLSDRFQHLSRVTDRSPAKPMALPHSHKQYVDSYRDDDADDDELAYSYHHRRAASGPHPGARLDKPAAAVVVSARTNRSSRPVELPVEETSPPSSTSSDKPPVQPSLLQPVGRAEQDLQEPEPSRPGSMLLQLIACGSTLGPASSGGGSSKCRAEPRRSCGLVSRLSARAGADEEEEDEDAAGGELGRRFGRLAVNDKAEYFSGSIVEGAGGRGTPLPASSLKRSNSYNEER